MFKLLLAAIIVGLTTIATAEETTDWDSGKYDFRWLHVPVVCGTTPEIQRYLDDNKFVLEKNPFYWERRNIDIQRVVYLLEDHHILHKFRSDEVDITSIPSWEISWTKRNLPEQLHVNKYLKTYAYVFNFRSKAIANNPKLREALSLAIDRSKISQMINMGEYSPAYELIPPGVPGYEYAQFFVPQMLQEERENKARKLYKEAGYSKQNPLYIEVRYHTSEESCKVADLIAKMWRDVLGVKVKLVRHRWLSYEDFKMCDFTFDVLKHSWVMHYIDPCAILQQFTSHLIGQNISGYSNKIFDQLVEEVPAMVMKEKKVKEEVTTNFGSLFE